jgi:hypothetical protein
VKRRDDNIVGRLRVHDVRVLAVHVRERPRHSRHSVGDESGVVLGAELVGIARTANDAHVVAIGQVGGGTGSVSSAPWAVTDTSDTSAAGA